MHAHSETTSTDLSTAAVQDGGTVVVAKPPPRSKLACKTCRAIKVRCIRPPEPNTACARCNRYGLQCNDPPVIKRKGRPPNSQRRQELAAAAAAQQAAGTTETDHSATFSAQQPPHNQHQQPQQQAPPLAPPGHQNPHQHPHAPHHPHQHSSPDKMVNGSGGGDVPLAFPFTMSGYQPNTAVQQVSPTSLPMVPQPASSQSLNTTVSPTSQTYTTTHGRGSNHNLNMAEYLDPTDKDMQTCAPKAPFFSNAPARRSRRMSVEPEHDRVNESDDPVSLRALSEVEANSLVQLFHQRLNPLVAVLDGNLHTMSYLRRTSSVLFSTVLASSSRFFRHDLHPTLLSHARTVLDRALQAGSTDIGVVQSLMLLTYWKDPEDTSGWMKVGMAIRLGYSLFWHIPRTDPLPDDEMEAREMLNAERTWYCLFSFDRGQSYVHGLPTTIRLRDHGDSEIWAREHLHLGPSVDMHISASIQLCKLKDHWGEVCESKCSDPAYLELAIETLTTQCDALIEKWFSKEAPPPNFDQDMEHVLLWSILDLIFIMKRFRLDMAPNDPLRLDDCLHIVSRIADEIDILANNGMLVIMQDSASCMTSSLAVFMRKVFRYSNRSQKSYILTMLHRVLLAHASVTNEDSKTAPAYVARFIRRVLSALSVESRAGSPGPDSGLLDTTQDLAVDFFAELGLEEFMHVPEYVERQEADDGRYWASMLLSEVFPQ